MSKFLTKIIWKLIKDEAVITMSQIAKSVEEGFVKRVEENNEAMVKRVSDLLDTRDKEEEEKDLVTKEVLKMVEKGKKVPKWLQDAVKIEAEVRTSGKIEKISM